MESNKTVTANDLLLALTSAVARLREDGDQRRKAASELGKLAKETIVSNRKKLAKALPIAMENLGTAQIEDFGLGSILNDLKGFLDNYEELIRHQLGVDLKRVCEENGLELQVISREEPVEVRISPLAVILDFKKSKAEVLFARQKLDSCPLSVDKIMATREKALKALEKPFVAEQFFEQCRAAYIRCLTLKSGQEGDRVELNDFLPELAFLVQSKRFRQDPSRANYRQYGKAEFAYDVMRLQKSGGLRQAGWRINFGVATGTTATKKGRVIYLEDHTGRGEYKLTIFFTGTGE